MVKGSKLFTQIMEQAMETQPECSFKNLYDSWKHTPWVTNVNTGDIEELRFERINGWLENELGPEIKVRRGRVVEGGLWKMSNVAVVGCVRVGFTQQKDMEKFELMVERVMQECWWGV